MRRRDFLKALSVLPLVGPLLAAAAERPAKVVLAGQRAGKNGHPTYGRGPMEDALEDSRELHDIMREGLGHKRLHAGIQRFDNCLRDGDTTEIPPEWAEEIVELICHSEEGVSVERMGAVVLFRVPAKHEPASAVLETRWLSDKWPA